MAGGGVGESVAELQGWVKKIIESSNDGNTHQLSATLTVL